MCTLDILFHVTGVAYGHGLFHTTASWHTKQVLGYPPASFHTHLGVVGTVH